MTIALRENQGPKAQNGGNPETDEDALILCTAKPEVH